jgi:hypothetical protein
MEDDDSKLLMLLISEHGTRYMVNQAILAWQLLHSIICLQNIKHDQANTA